MKKDNRPPKRERTRKHGDVREDGMVFWGYCASAVGGEWWVTPEKFAERREYLARYRQAEGGRAKRREYSARYRQTKEGRAKRRKHDSRYRQTEEGRIACVVRDAARRAAKFAGRNKPSRSFELLGADLETFKAHIETQFTEGMSWENHGEWHIDHIIPLASGKTPEEIWKLCHYTNLQPLWAVDNIRKGAKHAKPL